MLNIHRNHKAYQGQVSRVQCFIYIYIALLSHVERKGGIAHLVDCWTEKPWVILMLVQFPSASRDFSPSQLSVQALFTEFVHLLCVIAGTNVCVHVKNAKHRQAIPLFGHPHTQKCTHW